VAVLARMGERSGPAVASAGASGSAAVASGSGSGHMLQDSNVNEAVLGDGWRQSFSSESTIPSVPVITFGLRFKH